MVSNVNILKHDLQTEEEEDDNIFKKLVNGSKQCDELSFFRFTEVCRI